MKSPGSIMAWRKEGRACATGPPALAPRSPCHPRPLLDQTTPRVCVCVCKKKKMRANKKEKRFAPFTPFTPFTPFHSRSRGRGAALTTSSTRRIISAASVADSRT